MFTGIDDELEVELELSETSEPDKNSGDVDFEGVIEPVSFDDENDNDMLNVINPDKNTSSLIDDLLQSKGINNGKVLILDENDKEEEVDFYGLSKEEQLEILNYSPKDNQDSPDLQPIEANLISYLRENEISLEDYFEAYKNSIIQELNKAQEVSYDIDAYDDEELYVLDLKTKYDLSDEELVKELEKALEDKDLFTKKVSKLRTDYKQLEDNYRVEQEQESLRQQEEAFNQYANTMVDVAVNTPELHGIILEDSEKNDVLSYLLEAGTDGVSEFYKALRDPKRLYEAAWFLRYGSEAINAITGAYEAEIAKLKKDNPPKVVLKTNKKTSSLHDLY